MNARDELDGFKREIDLREFALSLGYEIDKRESWRGSTVLRRGGDKIVVKRNSNGHYVYFSVRDDRDNGGGMLQFLLVFLFQIVFSILGSLVVCWFSRQREFRADAGGARLAGRENMINALRALRQLHDPEAAVAEAQEHQAFQALKISGVRGGLFALFATHPPIEERIARLEQGSI